MIEMIIKVSYGKKEIKAEVDRKNILGILEPPRFIVGNELKKIRDAIKTPVKPKDFNQFLGEARDITIIVDDWTRPTPTEKALEAIYPWIKDKKLKILVATGAHRLDDKQKLELVFGRFLKIFKDQIYIHDARNSQDMAYFGKTRRGTEVYLNKLVEESDRIIVIGSITPHWFAGFCGGRKIFLPGVSSFETIEQNHRYAVCPEAQLLDLDNNPVHRDMVEVLEFPKLRNKQIFSIQLVLWGKRIYQCFAGDIKDSFLEGTKKAREIFSAEISEKADIVVSVNSPPYDKNLYQSQKTLESGKLALKKGGILILVSSCKEGIGDEKFFNLLAEHRTPEKALKKISGQFGCHKASKIALLAQWAEIWAITDLSPQILKKVFIESFSSLQEAIDRALKKKGSKSKILFIMDGNLIVPIFSG